MYSYGSPHMATQKQGDQLERTFSSYVRIQDVVLKTYLGRWMIGRSGERGSGISVLPARYDDDDEVYLVLILYLHSLKWFIILLSHMNSFIWMPLNGFKYHYVILKIQFRHTVKEFQVLLTNTKILLNMTDLLNCSKYWYISLTIELNISP